MMKTRNIIFLIILNNRFVPITPEKKLSHPVKDCSPNNPCAECEGDCDIDDDCAPGLICYYKDIVAEADAVPGCSGIDFSKTDWCVRGNREDYPIPLLHPVKKHCSEEEPCKRCQGHCFADNDCEEGLICHFKDHGVGGIDSVPGCIGTDLSKTDWCIIGTRDPSERIPLVKPVKHSCSKDDPCDRCEGHCIDDAGCKSDLVCFLKGKGLEGIDAVPGCLGTDLSKTNWCTTQDAIEFAPSTPTSTPTQKSSSTDFPLTAPTLAPTTSTTATLTSFPILKTPAPTKKETSQPNYVPITAPISRPNTPVMKTPTSYPSSILSRKPSIEQKPAGSTTSYAPSSESTWPPSLSVLPSISLTISATNISPTEIPVTTTPSSSPISQTESPTSTPLSEPSSIPSSSTSAPSESTIKSQKPSLYPFQKQSTIPTILTESPSLSNLLPTGPPSDNPTTGALTPSPTVVPSSEPSIAPLSSTSEPSELITEFQKTSSPPAQQQSTNPTILTEPPSLSSLSPTASPSDYPTTGAPTSSPTVAPLSESSNAPSFSTSAPTEPTTDLQKPSSYPVQKQSTNPTVLTEPSLLPSLLLTSSPSDHPLTGAPTPSQTVALSSKPINVPSSSTSVPTDPTTDSQKPSSFPVKKESVTPTIFTEPTSFSSLLPTGPPLPHPSIEPTILRFPAPNPTFGVPTTSPAPTAQSVAPTGSPGPTGISSQSPSIRPITGTPSSSPTLAPSLVPSSAPSSNTSEPTELNTEFQKPSLPPSQQQSKIPTILTESPSLTNSLPTSIPSNIPSNIQSCIIDKSIIDLNSKPEISNEASGMVELMNWARNLCGVVPNITEQSTLTLAAKFHSDDMATRNYFSHIAPTPGDPIGVQVWDRVTTLGFNWCKVGENIAATGGAAGADAAHAFDIWWNSDGHRRNILDNNFTDAGYAVAPGLVNSDWSAYYTTVFAKGDCQ